jgi:hypothetical protein
MFLLDLLDSMPHLRLSTDQLKFVLWMLHELGVQNVPSLKSLRKVQERLRRLVGIETNPKAGVTGNLFYMNNIASLIALVRPLSNSTIFVLI